MKTKQTDGYVVIFENKNGFIKLYNIEVIRNQDKTKIQKPKQHASKAQGNWR